ncbi:LolA family protein [Tundrisphaera sp. TA3]|uniref:LolA family protein n=1 Tax=Tundrisphaera sp. TA3 TaxID=3435775 RepID=UPI003EB91A6C
MPDERFDRILAEFRDRDTPDGPPADVVARTLAALRNEPDRRPKPTLAERIRTMPPFLRIAAGLLAAAAITGLVAIETSSRGPRAAFAQAIEQVRAARTMTYTMRIGDLEPIRVSRMEPGLIRTEMPGGGASIIDRASMKTLVLEPTGKTATVVAFNGPGKPGGWGEDQIDQLREFKGKPEDDLGEKLIDGRPARGFRVAAGGWTSQVWVDAATNLPTRVESQVAYDGTGPKTVVCDQFAFDPPLDPELFRMTPPEGYTIQKLSTDIGKAAPVEQDLVDVLGDYAKRSGGRFPNDLQMPSLIDVLGKIELGKDGFDEATNAWIVKIGRGVGLVWAMPPTADAVYTGKDVRLGRADAPIFRYRPQGSPTYRVIYGDLSVKDVDPARFAK